MKNVTQAGPDCNTLQVFNSGDFGEVRTILRDGEPWFVAADVCRALDVQNSRDALTRLDDDEKGVVLTDTLGGPQDMSIVNEPGLYSLVIGSRKPEAKAFKRWIIHEVIPSIRKTGSYTARRMSTAEMMLEQARIAVELERKVNELSERTEQVNQRITDAVSVFAVPTVGKDGWQEQMNKTVSVFCEQYGLSHQKVRGDMYAELEEAAGADLTARQNRLRARMRKGGATYKDAMSVTKLHVIAQDQKLRAIYEGIVRRYTAQRIAG